MLKHFMLDPGSRGHDHRGARSTFNCVLVLAGLQAAACADEYEGQGVGGRLSLAAVELDDGGVVVDAPCGPGRDSMDASVGSGASVDGGTLDARTGVAPDGGPEATAPGPSGLTIERVSALGTGCPRGTTTGRIDQDGAGFTLQLAGGPISIDADAAFRPVTCGVSIFVKAPAGTAYAIESFSASGEASLGEGQSLRLTSSYGFTASMPSSGQRALELRGPHAAAFRFEQTFSESEQVFSPCGGGRFVNVDLSLNLRNGMPRRVGSYQLSDFGSVRFVTRSCTSDEAPRTGAVTP